MNTDLRTFFGFKALPFAPDITDRHLYKLQGMLEINERIQFAAQANMYFMIIGDVGSGKSTALRYACSQLPSKRYHVINIVGGSWSFMELLRQILYTLGKPTSSYQPSSMLQYIYESLHLIRTDGRQPILVIDEAHLFRLDAYSQLHLLTQQNLDNAQVMPIVLCGQELLFDRMQNPAARPLMSRILSGYNLRSLSQDETFGYIRHHVKVVGSVNREIFDEPSLIAISQASAGIPRKINSLCLLALQMSMQQDAQTVTSETIRKIAQNWWE